MDFALIAKRYLDDEHLSYEDTKDIFQEIKNYNNRIPSKDNEDFKAHMSYWLSAYDRIHNCKDSPTKIFKLLVATIFKEDIDGSTDLDHPYLRSKYNLAQACMIGFINCCWNIYFTLPKSYSDPKLALLESLGDRNEIKRILMNEIVKSKMIDVTQYLL